MAVARDNLSQTEQAYRRELSQTRRLPRLQPEPSPVPEASDDSDQAESDYDQSDTADPADEFGDTAATEEDNQEETETAEQEEEEIEEEELQAEEEAGPAGGGKSSQQAADRLKKEAVKKSQEAVKRLAGRLKIVKIGTALTVVGLIVTYLVMTFQFIAGNCLQKPLVPKLSMVEIILWALVTMVILLAIILLIFILILGSIMAMGTVEALKLFIRELVDIIF